MKPDATPPAPTRAQQVFVWWVLWLAILGGSIVIYVVLGGKPGTASAGALAYAGLAPLVMSFVLRWLVLPGAKERRAAMTIFVVGMALAEGATILAVFLGSGTARDAVAVLGILGVIQWIPLFAGDYSGEAKAEERFR